MANAEFTSGALRSEKKLPYWRIPFSVLRAYAKRAQKGEKYDIAKGVTHNWKLGIKASDQEFYRQLFDHGMEHLFKAKEMAGRIEQTDDEGEGLIDHLSAAVWNISNLCEVFERDPEGLRKALNQECQDLNI